MAQNEEMVKDFPLSVFAAAARTTLGGAGAMLAGLVLGSAIVFSEGAHSWWWYATAWIVLIPYTVANVWGLLLVPILGAVLIGLIWYDWNRAAGIGFVALALAAAVFLSAGYNPFREHHSLARFLLLSATAVVLIVAGMVIEAVRKWPHRPTRQGRACDGAA